MCARSALEQTYADELDSYVEGLAAGHVENVLPALAAGSSRDDVARYVENAVGERARMLDEDTRLVALAFEDFGSLVIDYLRAVPRPNYCYGQREATAFLAWLAARPLDTRQADFIAFQRAEFACLELAHLRQTELRKFRAAVVEPEQALARLQREPRAELVLSPVRDWTELSGRSLGRDDCERTPVLFAPLGGVIRHYAFRARVRRCLQTLESQCVATLRGWQAACELSREEAIAIAHDWLKQEIVVVA